MYGYLIGSRGESDWKVDPKQLVRSLQENWIGISVHEITDGPYLLNWVAEVRGFPALGGLQSDAQTISIDHTDSTVEAEFVLWYRRFVLPEYELFLYSGPRWQMPLQLLPYTAFEEVIAWLEQG